MIGTDPATRRSVSVLSLGAMLMGTRTDEETSFAILDRYVEAGGTFIDTSGNYAFWVNGTRGGESEELLGRWRRSRGGLDDVVIATKVGARPLAAGSSFDAPREGLSAKAIRESASRSMARLGVSRLDLMYAHIEDPSVPAEETVGAFGELVASGEAGLLGVSNHWSWRVERARSAALALGVPGYEVLQYHYSYLRPRADLPGRDTVGSAFGDLLSLVRSSAETGATVNQVVLAWLMGGELPVIPLVGASSVAQLEESLGAVDLELTAAQRARLDEAH